MEINAKPPFKKSCLFKCINNEERERDREGDLEYKKPEKGKKIKNFFIVVVIVTEVINFVSEI